MPRPPTKTVRNRLIGAGLLVILVIAMVLNTKFLTPEEVAAIAPKPFEPAAVAGDLYTKATSDLSGQAAPLGEVVPALQSDVKGAAEKYHAVSPNEGAYDFPVTATGKVTEASASSLRLQVEGVPSQTPIIVPLSTAVNGTPVRDVMGFKFADAPGQTEYQYVADELKKLMIDNVDQSLADPASLKGKKVTLLGVVSVQVIGNTVPKPKPINVQPVTIEAA
ncbi:MAG: DUF2291 family protein [Propionibacteriaceae bacterium]